MRKTRGPARAETSEWPLVLLMDEVWLRVRRVLVHRLEASGIWPEAGTHRRQLQQHRDLGACVSRDTLSRVLGADDLAVIGSESVYARASPRLPIRLPLVLAFGYDLGWCFSGLLEATPEDRERAAELSAVFNLGISLFDLIHDRYPELVKPLGQQVGESALRRLESADACKEMATRLPEVAEPELRILLRIIAWFYGNLPPNPNGRANRETLHNTLLEAYHAEMGSGSTRVGERAVSISRAKSTLPFTVIHNVASLLGQRPNPVVNSIASHIGTIFWLIDDLTDLVSDFRDGAVNSILARGSIDEEWGGDPIENRWVLSTLLSSGLIEDAVDSVDRGLTTAYEMLRSEGLPVVPARRLSEGIGFYVRSWLE